MRLVSSSEMLNIEREAEEIHGLSTFLLMERAGAAVASQSAKMVPVGSNILIVCGKGNNGGDGFVAARILDSQGYNVVVVSLASPDKYPPAARAAFEKLPSKIKPILLFDIESEAYSQFEKFLNDADLVIDAIFGFSLKGAVRGVAADIIDRVNSAQKLVLSVDLPSGLEADTGKVYDRAIVANVTVTFTTPKVGMLLYPGFEYVGELITADIGIPAEVVEKYSTYRILDKSEIHKLFPMRTPEVHKKSIGQVLIIAGSFGMAGAAVLAARSAYRMGAGLVAIAAPQSIVPILNSSAIEVIIKTQAETEAGTLSSTAYESILELSDEYDAVLIGPGLTTHHDTAKLIRRLIADIDKPMVIDADGLNALVERPEILRARLAQTIITPHPGELARIFDVTSKDIVEDWLGFATKATEEYGVVTVLKGARTIISGIDEVILNTTGNPGLATAGTGDVLAGMIVALLAQKVNRFYAASIATYLHGLAADIAVQDLTEYGLIASDVIDYLPDAIRSVLEDVFDDMSD